MHCPQCGLQQGSGEVRFCRACGFALSGVKELVLPDERAAKTEKKRFQNAFNQGLALMLVSLVVAIVLTLLKDAALVSALTVKIVAAVFVLAGLARMFSPYIAKGSAEPAGPKPFFNEPTRLKTTELPFALPASPGTRISNVRSRRVETSEIVQPPSITEHTTKTLKHHSDRN